MMTLTHRHTPTWVLREISTHSYTLGGFSEQCFNCCGKYSMYYECNAVLLAKDVSQTKAIHYDHNTYYKIMLVIEAVS